MTCALRFINLSREPIITIYFNWDTLNIFYIQTREAQCVRGETEVRGRISHVPESSVGPRADPRVVSRVVSRTYRVPLFSQ